MNISVNTIVYTPIDYNVMICIFIFSSIKETHNKFCQWNKVTCRESIVSFLGR